MGRGSTARAAREEAEAAARAVEGVLRGPAEAVAGHLSSPLANVIEVFMAIKTKSSNGKLKQMVKNFLEWKL